MNKNGKDTILVTVADSTIRRGRGPKPLEVDVLAENVNIFLGQVEGMLSKAPDKVGKFELTEITITAEVSTTGALMLLGTGGEVSATGGLTFKFVRPHSMDTAKS